MPKFTEFCGKWISFGTWANDSKYDGYSIITENGTLDLIINKYQICCENIDARCFGDVKKCWNGNIIDVSYTHIEEGETEDLIPTEVAECLDLVPNDMITDKRNFGLLLIMEIEKDDWKEKLYFIVSNYHNGYYAHEAKITFNDQPVHSCWL